MMHPDDRVVRRTEAPCPDCGEFVPAEVVVRGRLVLLKRECREHGHSETVLSRYVSHYLEMESLLPPETAALSGCEAHPGPARGVFINLTDRCNMSCPNCLTNANPGPGRYEESLEDTLAALATLPPPKPAVCLGGGEPTLREDLPRWISSLQASGYQVKLLTNGLKLEDPEYCRALKEAGLRWVLLQFDSPDEVTASVLRGRRGLAAVRARVLANCTRFGFDVCLSCMIEKEHNLQDLAEIVRYGMRVPCVRHVSLLPARRLGRNRLTADDAFLEECDVMDALERQTGGRIRRKDWIRFAKVCAWIHRVTGWVDFKPRRCFLVLPIVGTEESFFPITRVRGLLDPRHLPALAWMALEAGRIERVRFNSRTLLLSIEAFRETATLDRMDALRCSRFYLSRKRFVHPCLFNAHEWPRMQRERVAKARDSQQRAAASTAHATPPQKSPV